MSWPTPRKLQNEVALAPLTTLEMGGAARHLAEVGSLGEVEEIVGWARDRDEPIVVVGGGSNVVVDDRGFGGLVLRPVFAGLAKETNGSRVLLTAGAGLFWDEVVAEAVSHDLAGIECLAGIPGLVGATPIQNVGAYGQEVARVIERVRTVDLERLEERMFSAGECRFGYRTSIFRECPRRYLVTEVTFCLEKGGAPTLAYGELRRQLSGPGEESGLAAVREAVLALRRSKSMVLDPGDPNRRSVGSFFVNPVLTGQELAETVCRGREAGVLRPDETVPHFTTDEGGAKLSAGWLIERAGFHKGFRKGAVGISSAHALALVHHGGGSSSEIVELAREIRDGVAGVFGLELKPEPVFLGFASDNPLDD